MRLHFEMPGIHWGPDHGVTAGKSASCRLPGLAGERTALNALMTGALVAATQLGAVTCPDGSRTFLEALAGEWRGTAVTRNSQGQYVDAAVTTAFESALMGCGAVAHEQIRPPGRNTTSVVLITARDDDSVELARADSEHGGITVSMGRIEGNALEVTWSRELGDRILRTRTTVRLIEAGQLEVERRLARSLEAEWELTYRARLARNP